MYKLLYDNKFTEVDKPLPNLQHIFPTNHSEIFAHFGKGKEHMSDFVQYTYDEFEDGINYIYPIEIQGGLFRGLEMAPYSNTVIKLINDGRCKIAINYSHESFMDNDSQLKFKLNQLKDSLNRQDIDESNVLFFCGDSNLPNTRELLKNYNFNFCYNDSIIYSAAQKAKMLVKEQEQKGYITNHQDKQSLGYKSQLVNLGEIDSKIRSKRFFSQNRNTYYTHRFMLGTFLEGRNYWDDFYASFLSTEFPLESHSTLPTGDKDFDILIKEHMESFYNKTGTIEIDTQNVKDKVDWDGNYEGGKYYKKEAYLDSYINIATETRFEKESGDIIFVTDKVFHGVLNYQPFMIFSSFGFLKYIKDKFGFKSFPELINEEYDIIEDDGRRLKFLCDEIDRLHNKPIEEIHELYLSVKDKLIHNRKVFLDLADKDCWTSYFDEAFK